ncbi:hypothetical protein [Methylobacterium iners]|uniref:Uncharacterized protein n=1 Tax=Methylobacterium iners TaxID=418707 RepID=A0ABQ4RUE7_9HYPH|nr:hypothetical protein [Methylobacterium iners]GJD93165.1 hypothetical protein OCOJLMKI_0355 [Methylobacterium iners]
MTDAINPAAPHHLPMFIAAADGSDMFMSIMAVVLTVVVLVVGLLFLRLHTLPERIAHKSHKLQFEIVAVLGLLALFTHIHLFWVLGLLLALIDIPNFGGVFGRMARALERIAGLPPEPRAAGASEETESVSVSHEDVPPPSRPIPRIVPASTTRT